MATLVLQAITGAHTPACLQTAIDSVETVTPPFPIAVPAAPSNGREPDVAARADTSILLPNPAPGELKPASESQPPALLFLCKIDAFVLTMQNAGANLGGRPAQPGLLISVKTFLGAGVALRAVQPFIATAQAGVT